MAAARRALEVDPRVTFTPEVYELIREGAKRSAATIVPRVYDLLKPTVAVDVGCGEGWFAREFAARGCHVLALDESVASPVDEECGTGRVLFRHADLAGGDAWAPYAAEIVPELVVCLEVAEHLSPGVADPFVASLCAIAPVVLFSAAIPGQGGHGHLNEQWPDYWADLFRKHGHGYVSGALRLPLWRDERVEPWYAQNLLLCTTVDAGEAIAKRLPEGTPDPFEDSHPWNAVLRLVHPTIWEHRRQRP